MRPSCSLITSTYNWPEALELVLLSIKNQDVLPDEMIIADDGSTKDTKDLIERYQKHFPVPLKHVWIEDKGFRKSIVLNMAYAMAKGDYCIQLDGDSIAHPSFVKDHLDFAQKGTFIQGSRVFLIEEKSKKTLAAKCIRFKFWSTGIVNRLNAMRIPFLRSLMDKPKASIAGIRGSNTAFWRADLVAVNGYNEEMTGWGREDSELGARFVNSGLMRRKLKFGAIQYHIYHKEASRNRLNINDEILAAVISNKIKSCTKGMDQYAG